jgi:predicted nuclease with TOPRIM domain
MKSVIYAAAVSVLLVLVAARSAEEAPSCSSGYGSDCPIGVSLLQTAIQGSKSNDDDNNDPEFVEKGDENHLGGFGGAMKKAISGILDPLKEKVDGLQEKLKEAVEKQSGADMATAVTQLQEKLEKVEEKLEEKKKKGAAAKAQVEATKADLSSLKDSLGEGIKGTASSSDLATAESKIQEAVEKAAEGPAASSKKLSKVVGKNQKYIKRIYKDLHHR